jgi:uncharacterized sporulation protein YeaH/YhbH (DUF444 family)
MSKEDTDEIKKIKNAIRELVKEIIFMDKELRKDINLELKNVNEKLFKPEQTSKLLNIKI